MGSDVFQESLLVLESTVKERLNGVSIIQKCVKLSEQIQVEQPLLVAKAACNNFGKSGICTLNPPSLADSIRDTQDPTWEQLIEILKDDLLQNVCVLHRYPIDSMAC